MSLKLAVLGEIVHRPGYAYAIADRLNQRFPHWTIPVSSVYPHTAGLENKGLIRIKEVGPAAPRVRGRDTRSYEATPEGRAFFEAWMCGRSELAPFKDDLLWKIAYAGVEDLPQLIELTRLQEQECLDQELALAAWGNGAPLDDDVEWVVFGQLLVRDQQLALWRARKVALQQARAALKRRVEREERGSSA